MHDPQEGSAADPFQTEEPPRVGMVSSLDELPHVAAYLKRIGATVKNMHSAVIEAVDDDGYPYDAARIMFDLADGSVTVTKGDAECPTKDEAEAIAAEIKRATFPKPVKLAGLSNDLPDGIRLPDPNVFVCHDFDDKIVMLHQRYETEAGKKGFLPWTKWSDGQWRQMEPDVLPFYGLLGYKNQPWLVLHEGAKAAARLKRMQEGSEDTDKFPWWSDLSGAHHVGWIGGTRAIDKSEWARLAALGWSRVTIVADNDTNGQGMRAAQTIAKRFPGIVEIVSFDERFRDGFDLGDPWPEDQFDERKRYIGPALRDCILPATQATRLIPPPEGQRGAPTKVLRDEYARQIAYTADPPRIFYRSNPSRDMRPETFNIRVAPFSHAVNTAALVWRHLACQHERMVYRPGARPGTLNIDGSRCFNVYEGAQIQPVSGKPDLWLAFLAHLIRDPDERHLAMKWIATLIARPDIRMRYGMLLISQTQGVGKNTLGNILRVQVGPRNASFPSDTSVVDSAFNGWAARKRLIFVSEFYKGENRKPYDKLKALITDDLIEVNEKGVNQYELDNAATVIACSNSEDALHLDDEDRRWFVPLVTEELRPEEWWDGLHRWLAGDGPGIILHWAQQFVAKNGTVGTGDHAPWSKRKAAIAERFRSPALKLAVEAGEHLASLDDKAIVLVREVREWAALKLGFRHADGGANIADKRLGRADTITKGLKMVEGLTVWADDKRPKIGGTREAVVMNFAPAADATWADIREHHKSRTNKEVGLDDPM
jgi:hypothetical protein